MNKNDLRNIAPHHMMGDHKNMLYVSDLAENINENDLAVLFQEFKDNVSVILMNSSSYSSRLEASRGKTAVVVCKDPVSAEAARKSLNLRKLRGKTVRISRFEKDNSSRYFTHSNLFVKGIPDTVSARDVYEFFLQFGDINSAKIAEDEVGNHLGYGYIHFISPDSMQAAINHCNTKQVFGVTLEVKPFQKKNERINVLNSNNNIYVKNIPSGHSDQQIKELFSKFGTIVFFKSMQDQNNRKFAIVNFKDESSAETARQTMNGCTVGDSELFVDFLMKKSDRRRLITNKIQEKNQNLNSIYKFCNLHIRNLPEEVDEKILHEAFSQLGEIRSVKIPKYILETKEKNIKKEYTISRGFGFVCFVNPDHAKVAIERFNGGFIPGFEKAKRPLIIDYFQPKSERKQVFQKLNQMNTRQQPTVPVINPMAPFPYNMNPANMFMKMGRPQMGGMGGIGAIPPHLIRSVHDDRNVQQQPQPQQQQFVQPVQQDSSGPDLNYLKSLESDNDKRDYLGEFIFKKIENHPLTTKNNLTIDSIGKITGMILGIEDIQEIVDISLNASHLNQRIQEALELLNQ